VAEPIVERTVDGGVTRVAVDHQRRHHLAPSSGIASPGIRNPYGVSSTPDSLSAQKDPAAGLLKMPSSV
jgi:hypothetical protein